MLKKLLVLAAIAGVTSAVFAQEKELLRIIGEDKKFVVQTKKGPFEIASLR